MIDARVLQICLCCLALTITCAKPNQYTPHDGSESGDDAGSSTDDGPAPDLRSADDHPATAGPDGPTVVPDGAVTTDGPALAPDGPCGLPNDPRHCGTCDHDCTRLANVGDPAMVSCAAGACVVPAGACATGYAHCSGRVDDGCETYLGDAQTCGKCTTRCNGGDLCASMGGGYQCVSSCSGATPDKCPGACTDVRSDAHNCGSCGHDCTALPNVKSSTGVSCQAGHCMIAGSACATGYGHCGGGSAENGCETNISVPATCGCTGCSSGQSCTKSGNGYQCSCGGNAPDKCGSACVDLHSDATNCGACGHSCLGGACMNGLCQATQIYTGTDVVTDSLAEDGSYVYFKRSKTSSLTVLSRIPKRGGAVLDLTTADEGSGRVALVNGVLYWAKGDQLDACSAPGCSGPFSVKSQTAASYVTANAEQTKLFWARIAADPINGDIMTSPAAPTIQGTISNGPIFLAMTALGNDAYVHADNTVYRVSGNIPDIAPVGDGMWGLAVTTQSVFGLTDAGSGPLVLKKYLVSAIGTTQTATDVGQYASPYSGLYGLVTDEKNTYWLIGSSTESALRLLRCSVNGCASAPSGIAYVRVGTLDANNESNWLTIDDEAVYWGSPSGIFKIAK